MPFYKEILLQNNTTIYFWKINEEISDLKDNLFLNEVSINKLDTMKSTSHIKGFLAIRRLLKSLNYSDSDLFYDAFGKPFLKDGKKISISHSHNFACLVLSENNVGIDMELKSEKILKNISMLFKEDFILNFKGNKKDAITLTTFAWSIKEAVFKLIPENDVSFKDNISIQPFQIKDNKCVVKVEIADKTKSYTMHFEEIENYTFVYVVE